MRANLKPGKGRANSRKKQKVKAGANPAGRKTDEAYGRYAQKWCHWLTTTPSASPS